VITSRRATWSLLELNSTEIVQFSVSHVSLNKFRISTTSWVELLRSGGVITWKTSSDPVSSREPIVVHQFQGQRLRSQAHIVCYVHTSHLCLFFIRETKCCTCVTTGGWGHTVSAEPGGYTACYAYFSDAVKQKTGSRLNWSLGSVELSLIGRFDHYYDSTQHKAKCSVSQNLPQLDHHHHHHHHIYFAINWLNSTKIVMSNTKW